MTAPRQPRISPDEIATLILAANGLTNVAIAHRLTVDRKTVMRRLERLYRKLGARDRANAVALAMTRGLITAADIRRPANQPEETIR